jgi:signal transduction histidine kinase
MIYGVLTYTCMCIKYLDILMVQQTLIMFLKVISKVLCFNITQNFLVQLSIFLIDLFVGTYRLSSHARLEAFVIQTKINLQTLFAERFLTSKAHLSKDYNIHVGDHKRGNDRAVQQERFYFQKCSLSLTGLAFKNAPCLWLICLPYTPKNPTYLYLYS